ncbi:MAG: DUF4112 domain-containing protein [Pirellulales bacterium]|nr:DUF4112 domain-containing protein [Pirellulales bacterium]
MARSVYAGRLPWRQTRPTGDAADVEILARWLDSVFTLPGTKIRFGVDALAGLLPGAGDTLASLASLYILVAAHRAGASRVTLLRMGINIAVDLIVGAIPIAGDLFDVYFKSNQRHVGLLRRHLAATPLEARRLRRNDRWFVWTIVAALLLLLGGCVYAVILAAGWLAQLIAK